MTVNNYTQSPAGAQFTKNAEAPGGKPCLVAYTCPAGKLTIGWGHVGTDNYVGRRITVQEAEILYQHDIQPIEQWINSIITVPITQGQFDALVDIVFNTGRANIASSTLLRMLNSGNYDGAGIQFGRWVYDHDPKTGKPVILPGLVTRRKGELNMWNLKT